LFRGIYQGFMLSQMTFLQEFGILLRSKL